LFTLPREKSEDSSSSKGHLQRSKPGFEFFLVTQSLYLQNDVSSTCCGHAIYLVNENSPLLCNVHSLAEFDELFEGLSRRFGANLSSAKYIFSQVHCDSASKPPLAGAVYYQT
jgi:hypothetical protein